MILLTIPGGRLRWTSPIHLELDDDDELDAQRRVNEADDKDHDQAWQEEYRREEFDRNTLSAQDWTTRLRRLGLLPLHKPDPPGTRYRYSAVEWFYEPGPEYTTWKPGDPDPHDAKRLTDEELRAIRERVEEHRKSCEQEAARYNAWIEELRVESAARAKALHPHTKEEAVEASAACLTTGNLDRTH